MLEILPKNKRETAREYVTRVLKYNIVNLNLKPGQAISENEIAELLGVSRTPVREAFLELAKAYGLFAGEIPSFEHIGVDFDDGVFQDRLAQLKFYGQAKLFGFIPTLEAIQRVFNVPRETAEEWLQQVQDEQAALDPMAIEE